MQCSRCGESKSERLVHVSKPVVIGLFVFGFLLAWTLFGSFLHGLVEGNDRSRLPLWQVFLPALSLIGATVAGFARWKQPVCSNCNVAEPGWLLQPLPPMESARAMSGPTRRTVLRSLGGVGTGVAAAAGGVVIGVARNRGWLPVANDFFRAEVETLAKEQRGEWTGSRVVSYRRLGRTNEMVSDISLGAGQIRDVDVAREAIERGITYFDTSPDYSDTLSEQVVGEAIKGHRDKMFIATKFCRGSGHLLNETPVPEIIAAVEESLRRLQTDHVDLIHIHSCDRIDRLMAPNIHEAFDRMKEQGKVRFLGVSTHTPNLEEVANVAIDCGRFDVMMLAYHFKMWPNFDHILEKAKQNDVAVVAMKTLKGAMHTNLADFRGETGAYSQAAFRWVLQNPAVSCLVISIKQRQHLDEYLYASGQKPGSTDIALLEKYDRLTAGEYCEPHCGECLSSCPKGLPINDVLRYSMYFKHYGWEKEGMRHYAKLDVNAGECAGCPAPCAGSCPLHIPIRQKMMEAHRLLTLKV
jgi:predicted aldo/keto reductase-like oxidoreductase